ncbi:MAG: hypothetical protein O3A01_09135 [bacterium]|nr:hypothetical protein [bacterium]
MKYHVLLVGSNNKQGLTLAREYKKAGCLVSSLPLYKPTAQDYSNAILHSFRIQSPMENLAQFSTQLLEICTNTDITHVVPIDDEATEIVMSIHTQLSALTHVCTPTPKIYNIASNKKTLREIANSLNIPTLETTVVEELSTALAHNFTFPHYLKPAKNSTIINGGLGRHMVYLNTTQNDFNRTIRLTLANCPALIQTPIEGQGIGIGLIAKNGKILDSSCHKGKQNPSKNKGMGYKKTIATPKKAFAQTKELISALNYTGIAMVEWVEKNGNFILIEMNCRAWRSLPHTINAGCNIALGALHVHSDYESKTPRLVLPRAWKTNLLPKIMHWAAKKKQELNTKLNKTKSRLRTPFTKFRYALSKGPVDIEEIPAEKILFVCKGNVIRSAFSAHFLSVKRSKSVASAGTAMWRRRYAIYDGTLVAKSLFGLDMSGHISTTIMDIPIDTLKQYHVIYVYDFENYHTLLDYYPNLRRQIRFLDERQIGPLLWPVAIPDPFQKSKSEFQKTFRRIAKILK